jgi:hypothetical protein
MQQLRRRRKLLSPLGLSDFLPPRWGLAVARAVYPQLALWAAFYRRFAAVARANFVWTADL